MISAIIRVFGQLILWTYILLLLIWIGLHQLFGDTLWWLGLINSFTPLFFTPLLLFIPLSYWWRSPLYLSGLLIPITLFLWHYGALFLPKQIPPHTSTPPPISIMTFNMWSGSTSPETIDVIAQNGSPDIVAIQETDYDLRRLLQRELEGRYPYQHYEQTAIGRGVSLLSRYPVIPVRTELIIDLHCRTYRVTVDPDHSFMLYNCHPQSSNILNFMADGRSMAAQIERTFLIRKQLSSALAKEIATRNEPSIVVGDFNTTDQSESYALLIGELLDAHRMAGWGFGHTFPAYRGSYRGLPIPPRLVRIDLILYTEEFVAKSSSVSAVFGESDHLPVLATLAWRE